MAAFTYKNVYDNIVSDVNTQRQVTVAAVKAAEDVYAEVPGDVKRKTLATSVLNAPESYAVRFTLICCVDPTIVAAGNKSLADADVLAAVKSAWNAMAGV